MDSQAKERNRKFKVVMTGFALVFLGFALTALQANLKESYATMCSFVVTLTGFFFGANVWEKLGIIKSQK
jgi:uncharacterized membrane protein